MKFTMRQKQFGHVGFDIIEDPVLLERNITVIFRMF